MKRTDRLVFTNVNENPITIYSDTFDLGEKWRTNGSKVSIPPGIKIVFEVEIEPHLKIKLIPFTYKNQKIAALITTVDKDCLDNESLNEFN